jgi:N-dimethylarginine dimethylaminohydrolase
MVQWEGLRKTLEQLGADVVCLTPVPGLPDLVFTANAALIHADTAVLSRFRHFQRQGEEKHYQAWLAEHGFQIRHLPPGMAFEGAGDALFCGENLFAGYRVRSDILAHQQIAETIGCRVIPLELVDPRFYHLDTCFCPLDPASAVHYPPAFDAYGRKALGEFVEDLIPVSPEEACEFACNAVVLGRSVVTNTGCPELHRDLAERGFTPHATPLGEFLKAGGSAKCLTLRLDGEDAAAWKHQPIRLSRPC